MKDFAQGKNLKKEDSLMKNILWIILENFQPILGGLFFVFLCLFLQLLFHHYLMIYLDSGKNSNNLEDSFPHYMQV